MFNSLTIKTRPTALPVHGRMPAGGQALAVRPHAGNAALPASLKPMLVAALFAAAIVDAWAEGPEVTPYRPTVSNPAALPAPGYLEAEFGWAQNRDRREGTRQTSVPYLFKYAFSEDFGVLLGGDGFVGLDDGGARRRGVGDTSVALKLRHELNEKSALGLEAGIRLPTARTGLGSGKADYGVTGIFSTGWGDYDIDLNLGLTRRGLKEDGEGRTELAWAAALAWPIAAHWGAALEIAGAAREGHRGTAQLLGAASYRFSKRVVLDAGIARGLGQGLNWTAFAGLAVLFARR